MHLFIYLSIYLFAIAIQISGTKVAAVQGPNYKIAKDAYVGKTVRITKGKYARVSLRCDLFYQLAYI